MKHINVVNGPQNVSQIILGCMRITALSTDAAALSEEGEVRRIVNNSYEIGQEIEL